MKPIPYNRQTIQDSDIQSVVEVLKSDWLTTGPKVKEFENSIAEYLKIDPEKVIVVTSATAGLHCVYSCIGIQINDEIISSPMSFIATVSPALLLGAKIKFIDINLDGNINPNQICKEISNRTKAVTVVDFAGKPTNLNEVSKICKENNIMFIEDASHSLGSIFNGEKIGTIADCTVFSFFPTKNITTGEGGAIVCKDLNLARKIREFSRQGLIRDKSRFEVIDEGPWHQEVHEIGLNYRLPDILCALGISQLKKIEKFKSARNKIFDYYVENLKFIEGITLPKNEFNMDIFWHLFVIRVPANKRKEIFEKLHDANIKVQVNYLPIYRHPVFRKLGYNIRCENAEKFYSEIISLPIYPELKFYEIDYIIHKLVENLK